MPHVLVVHHDSDLRSAAFREALTRELAAHGHTVSFAGRAVEAIASLVRRRIDFVVCPLHAPGTQVLLETLAAVSSRTRAIATCHKLVLDAYADAVQLGVSRIVRAQPAAIADAIFRATELELGLPRDLCGHSVLDVLLAARHGKRSLALVVEGWDSGRVLIERGEVIHAASRELVGEPALRRILALPAGGLRAEPLRENPWRTIERPIEPLVLDALTALGWVKPAPAPNVAISEPMLATA